MQFKFIFRQCSFACLTLLQHLEKSSFDRSGQLLQSQTREIRPSSEPASTGSLLETAWDEEMGSSLK